MCAITGIISQIPEYNQSSFLEQMLSTMLHRGPDATSIAILGNDGCFGHNRLAIVDLHIRSAQPFWDRSQRYCLTFNGEIYNYNSLRKELIHKGHKFITQSDSEVLIEAWAAWGTYAIDRLRGMFAFAVWDSHFKKLYLVRDRMGEKPLFYAPIKHGFNNGMIFASDLKGLMRYPLISKKLSMNALTHYLSFNYTATEESIFTGTHKVPAAAYLLYDLVSGKCSITHYWSLATYFQNKQILSFDDAKCELDLLLQSAVKAQSTTDASVGSFLSGGIDSSTIVAYMQNSSVKEINSFSIGFNESSYSELSLSQKTARYLSVKNNSKTISSDVCDVLLKIINAFDEPFADSSLIPTYFLCEFAKEHAIKISLSGDGGDELFGGYITYQANRYHYLMQYFPRSIRKIMQRCSNYLSTSFRKISLDYKIKQFLHGCLLTAQEAHISWREVFNQQQKQHLLTKEYQPILQYNARSSALHWFKDVFDCHILDQLMYVDMKTWLIDDILVKVDRASMAHSLEVRAPFLDHKLVEFAASLPVGYKISGNKGKYILKESQRDRLPLHVLRQAKQGFNSPIADWLSGNLFHMAHDLTTGRHLSAWFNKQYIEKLWSEHKNGRCDHGHRLFNLLCLGIWCQTNL